jgi:hypothetical protein
VWSLILWRTEWWEWQWRIQDLKEGGARSIARAKILATPPKHWPRPSLTRSWRWLADKEGCFRPSNDEKPPFKEWILEDSKFIVGSSCQSSIFIDSICHWATELAIVPELRGVLELPELHARYATERLGTWRAVDLFCFSNTWIFDPST